MAAKVEHSVHAFDLIKEYEASVNFIVSVSCKMKKSELPKLQKLAKEQDVLVIGKVTGSTAGLSVDLEDCLVMIVADYQKIQNR